MSEPKPIPEVGRDLDALVAEKVMGWRWYRARYNPVRALFSAELAERYGAIIPKPIEGDVSDIEIAADWDRELPKYSTDIAAALLVIEKLAERGYWVKITSPWGPDYKQYWAGFDKHGHPRS